MDFSLNAKQQEWVKKAYASVLALPAVVKKKKAVAPAKARKKTAKKKVF